MFRPLALVASLVVAAPAAAADKKPDSLVELLTKLKEPVKLTEEPASLAFGEIFTRLEKDHGIRFVINDRVFTDAGENDVRAKKWPFKTRLTGLAVGRALAMFLSKFGSTYLVRKDYVEITTIVDAGEQLKWPHSSLIDPTSLVSAVFKEKPLNEAVAELADDYDATVVVAPQTGDARMTFVSARLMNVPLETALELLAVQADLRVVKRKNAYLVTTPDAANALQEEDVQKERFRAEVKLLKSGKLPPEPVKPADPNK